MKNKTFFFVTYEGTRQRQQLDFNSGVLSDAQRAAVTDPVVRNLLALIPTANRHQRDRRSPLPRHRHRQREHRPVDGRPQPPVRAP